MGLKTLIVFGSLVLALSSTVYAGDNSNETQAIMFLEEYNERAQTVYPESIEISWTYNTDITAANQQAMIDSSLEVAQFAKNMQVQAQQFNRTGFSYDTNRQLEKLLYIGDAAMEDPDQLEELNTLQAQMETRYSTGEVCLNNSPDQCLELEPGLTRIMATSRNYDELFWAWDGWREAVGAPAREDYRRYVELKNIAAQANDQPDCGAYWRSWYETPDLQAQVEQLYIQLKPLYQQLHAYVRRKLYNVYGEDFINLRGPIPAHILGNMWAQSWTNLLDLVEPYPGKPTVDITPSLVSKGYTPLQMFQVSDEFFTSLGLIEMPQEFWDKSMIEKPDDGRSVVCHASAWDFYNQIDFRIKQCTDLTMDDFITVHHEMGHVEYFLQYKEQPVVYRDGANPGFHEAVGDVLALSVSTPQHLYAVDLLDTVVEDDEADINYLMSMALDKIAFLPFGYLMDLWRWGVFDGSTPSSKYNEDWWKLRLEYQGIIPPMERNEGDFDPAAKYHIPASVPYIRYFISFVIQFQFHKSLCAAAGQEGPLYKCDIYQSEEAGTLLANMLKTGSSRPWPEAMEAITGQREMSALPLVEYFQPLIDWLEEQNDNEYIGWDGAPEWRPAAPGVWTGAGVATSYSFTVLFVLLLGSFLMTKRF